MYLFYIDETGNLDMKDVHPGMDSSVSKKDWLYVLTGLGIFEHKWRKFYDPIVAKKRDLIYPHKAKISLDQCEIKSNWLRISKERKRHPFLSLLTEKEVIDLIAIYYRQLLSIPAALVSVVIDKRYLQAYMDSAKLHRKAWEL